MNNAALVNVVTMSGAVRTHIANQEASFIAASFASGTTSWS